MRRKVTVLLTTLLVVFASGDSRSALPAQQTVDRGSTSGAQAQNQCQCPQIPAVATNDKPAPGKAVGELSFDDLEWAFSTLEARYNGDWDAAITELEHEIDPSGALKIWDKPAPAAANPKAEVTPGKVSDYLLGRVATGTGSGQRVVVPPPISAILRSFLGGPTSQRPIQPRKVTPVNPPSAATPPPPAAVNLSVNMMGFMRSTIVTIARANKYGEPTFGLRKATLRVARFLANDLARIPQDQRGNEKYDRLTGMAGTAKMGLGYALGDAMAPSPDKEVESRERGLRIMSQTWRGPVPVKDMQYDASKDELALDRWDLANAALDIILSQDEKGQKDGMLDLSGNEGPALMFQFYGIAARRAAFGGSATPGSPEDAVACKAFSILVALAQQDGRRGKDLRSVIFHGLTDINAKTVCCGPGIFNVAKAVVVLGGIADDDEARKLADFFWPWVGGPSVATLFGDAGNEIVPLSALSFPGPPLGQRFALIRDFENLSPGRGAATLRKLLDEKFAQIPPIIEQERKEIEEEKKRSVRPCGPNGELCSTPLNYSRTQPPENQQAFLDLWKASKPDMDPKTFNLCAAPETTPKFLLFVKTKFGLVLVDKVYQGVPMVIGVPFDEAYDKETYAVSISAGSQKLELPAKPYHGDRTLFVTEPFEIKK